MSKAVDHSNRAHARFSPSSFKYRELCPFWDNESDEDKDTTAADRGTAMHEATETEDLSKLEEHEVGLVQWCLDYIAEVKKVYVDAGVEIEHLKETKLAVVDQFGTMDHLILVPKDKTAHLMDTKFGWIAVDPAEINAQLQGYALAAFDEFNWVETIVVHILSPRLGKVSMHEFNRISDYDRIRLRIWAIIERAKNPQEYHPSPTACEYCGNRAKCKALAQLALTAKPEDNLPVPPLSNALTISSPQEMNALLKWSPVLEKWAKDIRQAALDMHLDEGWEYDDFVLAERQSKRTVKLIHGAYEALKSEMSLDEFLDCCSGVSVPELEKIFSARAERGKKASEAARLEGILRDAGVLEEQTAIKYLKQKKATKQLK